MPTSLKVEPLDVLSPLADQLPLGVCLVDSHFEVVLWNRTLEQWTGQPPHDVLGHCLLELFPNLNEPSFREQLERVFSKGETIVLNEEKYWHFIPAQSPQASSDQLMVQRTTVGLHGTDSKVAMITIEDCTLQHSQQQRAREQQQALETKLHEHVNFIAHMNQELRLPLDTIFGYAEFLRDHEHTPEQRAALEGMRRNGEKLVTVLNDSLDFAKIEAQQVRVDKSRFDLEALLRDVVSLVRITAAEQRIDFSFEYDSRLPPGLTTDATRLRQILLNLLANAVKYTNEGQVRLRVALRSSEQQHRVVFEVADTGMGMSSEQLAQLFTPFHRTGSKSPSGSHGSGLGLAISHRLTQMLGGQLLASSDLGQGSKFTLILPLTFE